MPVLDINKPFPPFRPITRRSTVRNISGLKLGILRVFGLAGRHAGQTCWYALCECGIFCYVTKASRSCGCRRGKYRHGMSKTRIYKVWAEMVQRCTNSQDKNYYKYGARGIAICSRWMNFEMFFADMGHAPVGHSLDRFPDNDGNYEPGNCRWATIKQQANNTRTNRHETINGTTRTLANWIAHYNTNRGIVTSRLKRGWGIIDALTVPSRSLTHTNFNPFPKRN